MSHIRLHKRHAILAMACATALLTACGGGGGGVLGSQTATNTLTGIAVDGYLQGASVFLDVNRNGVQDIGEPATTTDLSGRYKLDYSSVAGGVTGLSVIVTGGVDSDTGFAFTGKLSAPVESASQAQVVTPLTTLVNAMVTQGLAVDVSAAKQKVAAALGLSVDQLSNDPVAAIANNPGIYTIAVALQRSIQMLASANSQAGESAHESQERVIQALATAIRSQSSAVDVSQLVASLPLKNTTAAQQLVSVLISSIKTGVDVAGHEGAKSSIKAMDEIRIQMESDHSYSLTNAANKIDSERGRTTSRPYYQLVQNSANPTVINTIRSSSAQTATTLMQPANTAGRLLASNCFQCHGTGGVGGFEKIRGKDISEVREYLKKPANSSIMAAHAQGYTTAQLNAIISYLQQ